MKKIAKQKRTGEVGEAMEERKAEKHKMGT